MPIVSLGIAAFIAANLIVARRHNVVRVSRAVEECNTVFSRIPAGAAFIRVGYRMDHLRARFGFEDIAVEPLFHVAARDNS